MRLGTRAASDPNNRQSQTHKERLHDERSRVVEQQCGRAERLHESGDTVRNLRSNSHVARYEHRFASCSGDLRHQRRCSVRLPWQVLPTRRNAENVSDFSGQKLLLQPNTLTRMPSRAPSAAIRRAAEAPMPPAPPEMKHTLPAKRFDIPTGGTQDANAKVTPPRATVVVVLTYEKNRTKSLNF